ncbi:MAG: hypothetical protein K2X27_11075, partial [Candidatus Obscuribacterales bacterium]|nr:hypothetical protein [Candidatus Obscuribacterales bacterium]
MPVFALDTTSPPSAEDSLSARNAFVNEYLAFQPTVQTSCPDNAELKDMPSKSVEGRENEDVPDKAKRTQGTKPVDPPKKPCADFKFDGQLFLIGGSANSTFVDLVNKRPDEPKSVVVTLAS